MTLNRDFKQNIFYIAISIALLFLLLLFQLDEWNNISGFVQSLKYTIKSFIGSFILFLCLSGSLIGIVFYEKFEIENTYLLIIMMLLGSCISYLLINGGIEFLFDIKISLFQKFLINISEYLNI